jgi:iron complex outermembrane recepter protein
MNHAKRSARPHLSALSSAVLESLHPKLPTGRRPRRHAIETSLLASGTLIVASALITGPAKDVSAQEVLDEVTVTGSRIRREDFTANAPVLSVDEQMFDQTASIGVESILNRLPQFTPAVTQFTTADVQQTATNTVGVSTVSLRGLGPNRNLVLINGRRAMPVDPTMVIDTNSIPSSAIQRVEIISGGASAVYGADAVGGVVNFILKDDFEGASVDVRYADTQHGGNEEISVSALLGMNAADDRGNIMFGVERSTRSLQRQWERDWRLADFADPSAPGGVFEWGSTPWIRNEVNFSSPVPNVNTNLPIQSAAALAAWKAGGNDPTPLDTATCADCIFNGLPPGTIPNNVNTINYRLNDDGTFFTGMGFAQDGPTMAPGGYRFNGPLYDPNIPGSGGNHQGEFGGLPVFVRTPNGYIKENNLYAWASSPLERLSSFANGHFDLTDSVRVTAQASVSRTQTQSSLGATAANINQWAAAVPFGNELYRGNNQPLYPGSAPDRSIYDIPDSLIDVNGNGTADAGIDRTNAAYTMNGRFGVECDAAPTAAMPWLDGLPGCTMSEAWPTTPEVYNLFMSRPDPNQVIWGNRSPDYLRTSVGNGRSTTNTTTTMQFSLGLEGELPSGDDQWDMTISTGRSDNVVNQLGSVRLSSLRALYLFPNYGRNAVFDPNPTHSGFAESTPTCASGLPIIDRFVPSLDCVQILSPSLKNEREMTQNIFEANLVGDLVEMPSGPLQYALGVSHRDNSFNFTPDNLSDNANFLDPIAGTFPNEPSFGEFDVSEVYGELLIPIIEDGPAGVDHFTVELGGRVSDWSMENMPNLETYKALIDWGFTPRYRLRGGFNRAFRAPNLGELFIARTQIFGGIGTRDHCSQNLAADLGYGASSSNAAQAAHSYNICRQLMGETGAFEYYDNRAPALQPTVGNTGVSNSFGNRNLREEQADTFTLGTVMDVTDNVTLTVDWYEIEIKDMIALENADSIYQRCLDLAFNPAGNPNAEPCLLVNRDPANGAPSNVDRTFTNEGRAVMSGVDLQVDWSRDLWGGQFGLNSVANIGLKSTTQERPSVPEVERAGYNSCSLQIQCQRYDYRIFSTFSYFRGPWNASLRHQYWPELTHDSCQINPSADACLYSSYPDQHMFHATFGYRFAERYNLTVGIENLLDEDPPCVGAEPNRQPYAFTCEHASQVPGDQYNATFDVLGRRFFVGMTMEF